MTEERGRYVTVEEMDSTSTGQNMRAGAFVFPVAATDPTTETRGIEDGTPRLWVRNGRLVLSLFSRTLSQWFTFGDGVIGDIKMFAGAASAVEPGWQLCDGTNGTPDLRDKFVFGGSFTEIGEQQDEQAVAIADHTVSVGNHVDDVTTSNGSVTTDTVTDDGLNQKNVLVSHTTHLVSLNLAHSASATAHSITPYQPPYYRLAYIMKVA